MQKYFRQHHARRGGELDDAGSDPGPDREGAGRGGDLPPDPAGRLPGHRQGHERPEHEHPDEESHIPGGGAHNADEILEGFQLRRDLIEISYF